MKLLKLFHHQNTILAPFERANDVIYIPALSDLKSIDSAHQASAIGLRAILQRYAEGGRLRLNSEIFHQAKTGTNVWRFSKGRVRLYCFLDDWRLAILSHSVIKKQQATDKADIDSVLKLQAAYQQDKQLGSLEFCEVQDVDGCSELVYWLRK